MNLSQINNQLSSLCQLQQNIFNTIKDVIFTSIVTGKVEGQPTIQLSYGMTKVSIKRFYAEELNPVESGNFYIPCDNNGFPNIQLLLRNDNAYILVWQCLESYPCLHLSELQEYGSIREMRIVAIQDVVRALSFSQSTNGDVTTYKWYNNQYSFKELLGEYFRVSSDIDYLVEQKSKIEAIIDSISYIPDYVEMDVKSLSTIRDIMIDKEYKNISSIKEEYEKRINNLQIS